MKTVKNKEIGLICNVDEFDFTRSKFKVIYHTCEVSYNSYATVFLDGVIIFRSSLYISLELLTSDMKYYVGCYYASKRHSYDTEKSKKEHTNFLYRWLNGDLERVS